MSFAAAWACMRDEVVADFRETYGLDLPLGGGMASATDEELERWQVLFSQLPSRSRVACRLDADNLWDDKARLLVLIEHGIRLFQWSFTEDAKKKVNVPRPIQSPGERARNVERRDAALAARKEIADAFGVDE